MKRSPGFGQYADDRALCILFAFSENLNTIRHAHEHQRHKDQRGIFIEGERLTNNAGNEKTEYKQDKQPVIGDSCPMFKPAAGKIFQILCKDLAVRVQCTGHEQNA